MTIPSMAFERRASTTETLLWSARLWATTDAASVEVERAQTAARALPPRPEELSDLERLLFPRWMDHDTATGGPNYMGYVMCLLVVGLLAVLAILALAVALWP